MKQPKVYFAYDEQSGLTKIGLTFGCAERRVRDLMSQFNNGLSYAESTRVSFLGCVAYRNVKATGHKLEMAVHQQFAAFRVDRRSERLNLSSEWFRLPEALLELLVSEFLGDCPCGCYSGRSFPASSNRTPSRA